MDDTIAVFAQVFLGAAGAVALVHRAEFSREQQAGALHVGDQARQFLGQLFELGDEFAAAFLDVGADRRRQRVEHGAGDIHRARVRGHGVAVDALAIQLLGALADREHRQRILAGVQCLRIGFHVRGFEAREFRIVDHRQMPGGTDAGLNRIHQQQGLVLLGQFARGGIERARHGAARIAFAHHRLHEHGFDVHVFACGLLEGVVQGFDVVGFDGDDGVLVVLEAAEMLGVGLAGRIRIQHRQFGTTMEGTLDGNALDLPAGVRRTRIGRQFGMHVGDAAGQRHRLRTRVQAQELAVWTTAARVAHFLAQRARQAQLRQARRHDVGHDVRLTHGVQHRCRCMTETEHAVAAGIMDHGALERDQPRAACGDRDVRIHVVVGVEIDEAFLHREQLLCFVHRDDVREFGLELREARVRVVDGGTQFREARSEAFDGRVRQADGACLAARVAQDIEFVDELHDRLHQDTLGLFKSKG